MTWFPDAELLTATRGGHTHPGRMIHVWAEQAGFTRADIRRGAGAWCFSSDDEREYWGGSMAERFRDPGFVDMALREGLATADELERVARGWDAFRQDGDVWFGLLHRQILCRK